MPIKMSDATAVNGKKMAQTIDANCLAHGRGKFKELEEIFPVECGQVMDAIRKVYWYDDQTKGMGDQERLEYHQKHSGPVMRELREWIEGEFRDRRVEPNSSLGKAFQYMPPEWLLFYNHYSIAIHFCAALLGVSMIRDADAVVQNRILELRAETARQDIVTLRKSAAIGSPLAVLSARLRGYFDVVTLSFRIYIHESLTPEQALNRLVEHYKAWAVN